MFRKWVVVGNNNDSASVSKDWDIDRHLFWLAGDLRSRRYRCLTMEMMYLFWGLVFVGLLDEWDEGCANEWKDGVFEPPVEGGLCGHDCAVGVGWLVGLTRGGRLDSWWWLSLSAAAVGGVFRLSWNRGLKQSRARVAGPVEWDRS